MQRQYFKLKATILFFVLALSAQGAKAQMLTPPPGVNAIFYAHITTKFGGYDVYVTSDNVGIKPDGGTYMGYYANGDKSYDFVDHNFKVINDTLHLYALASNGGIVDFIFDKAGHPQRRFLDPPITGEQCSRIVGDALYLLSSNALRVSMDHGKTWNTDTAGLHGSYINDIATDSSQNVYIATYSGLFRQAASGANGALLKHLQGLPLRYLLIPTRICIWLPPYQCIKARMAALRGCRKAPA